MFQRNNFNPFAGEDGTIFGDGPSVELYSDSGSEEGACLFEEEVYPADIEVLVKPWRVDFQVPLAPVPMPRPRARAAGNRAYIYTPDKERVNGFKNAVKDAFLDRINRLGAGDFYYSAFRVELDVVFLMKSIDYLRFSGYPLKPDIDNLLKTVMDALNGVAWTDDAKVVSINCRKLSAGFDTMAPEGRQKKPRFIPKDPSVMIAITFFP